MADDIVPELLERIQKEFSEKLKRSAVINRIEKLITEGKATYIEAHEYANKVGEILAQCFRDNISLESLPNGKLYYNIAERIINATLGHNYDLVTTVTAHIQKELNKQAEISIIPQIPVKNQDRINGIIDYVSNAEKYDDKTRDFLEERAKNYTLSVVDDSVRENAKFHYNAGIRAKIIRTTYGHCCGWCANLAGTYDYADVSGKGNKVFQRHPYCKCTTEYISSMGRRENVWTHKTPGSEEDKNIRMRQYLKTISGNEKASEIRKKKIDFYAGMKNKVLPAKLGHWVGNNKYSELMNSAIGEESKKYIAAAYRKSSIVGDGGTVAARRFEIATGINIGRNRNSHEKKVIDLINQITKSLSKKISHQERSYLEKELEELKELQNK